jgi:predicted branched-subunit amino acid permease
MKHPLRLGEMHALGSFTLAQRLSHPAFKEGVWSIASVCVGIFAWGLMTGVAMVNSGLSLGDALAMALLVYAGSSQLAVLPLLAVNAPMSVVLATAFCVNLRFVVFSAHLRGYLVHYPLRYRLLMSYFTADVTYAQFTQRFPTPGTSVTAQQAEQAYLSGNAFTNWSSWMSGSILGIFLTHYIPAQWGVGFAGILALLGLTCKMVNTRPRALVACLSGLLACLTVALPLKLNILVAMVVSVLVCLALERYLDLSLTLKRSIQARQAPGSTPAWGALPHESALDPPNHGQPHETGHRSTSGTAAGQGAGLGANAAPSGGADRPANSASSFAPQPPP